VRSKTKWYGSLFLLSGLLILAYGLSPRYDFAPPRPFQGKTWYNPFQAETLSWSRANFHIHSYSWGGLTNGRQSPPQLQAAYQKLGYAWIGISDYQRVNPQRPIPLYEHGWSLKKVHQLCFWPREVVWIDFPLPQTRAIKQTILARLRSTTPFLVLAHPRFLHGYSGADLARLGGYDAIEVLNRYGDSVAEWDSALSSGQYAPILAHDNVHNVENPHELMSRWTEVALSPDASQEALRAALTAGRTVGYKNRTLAPIAQAYPRLARVTLAGETLRVQLTAPVDSIRLIGQGGTVRTSAYQTDHLEYPIRPFDTYLRLEAYTAEVELYASPLVRGQPTRRDVPPIAWGPTLLQWLLTGLTGLWLIRVGLKKLFVRRARPTDATQ